MIYLPENISVYVYVCEWVSSHIRQTNYFFEMITMITTVISNSCTYVLIYSVLILFIKAEIETPSVNIPCTPELSFNTTWYLPPESKHFTLYSQMEYLITRTFTFSTYLTCQESTIEQFEKGFPVVLQHKNGNKKSWLKLIGWNQVDLNQLKASCTTIEVPTRPLFGSHAKLKFKKASFIMNSVCQNFEMTIFDIPMTGTQMFLVKSIRPINKFPEIRFTNRERVVTFHTYNYKTHKHHGLMLAENNLSCEELATFSTCLSYELSK